MFSIAAYEYHRNKVFMKYTRQNLRDAMDPFDMPDDRFKEMYRLPRSLALDFLHQLNSQIGVDNLCPDIPLTIQLCATLNFFASGSYQRRVGSDGFAFISQTVVSRCIQSVSFNIATKLAAKFIRFPQSIEEIQELHDEMQQHTDFPGAFAIVDGTHIALTALLNEVEFAFMNRKGFHSINTQVIVDVRMRFLNVNARYPGSTHDNLVWRSSLVNSFLKNLEVASGSNWEHFMLADNGYPLQPWLLKPYDTPNTLAEELYNVRHRKLRSLVERAIGLLKARFRCLLDRKLHYSPLMSGHIIYACAILHNFLIGNKYPIDNIDPVFEEDIPNFDEHMEIQYEEIDKGSQIRDNLAEYFMDFMDY